MAGRRRDRTVLVSAAPLATSLAAFSDRLDPLGALGVPTLAAELVLAQVGRRVVAGVDEVGRGALAGPLVAAAVVLPSVLDESVAADLIAALAGARDSKRLTAAQRRRLAERVRAVARGVGVACIPAATIDSGGLGPANRLALRQALAALPEPPDYALLDAVLLPRLACDQTALVRGDARSLSIAAASILAKVARDDLLADEAALYPAYGFERHKGYGTAAHLVALAAHGPCPSHRRSFAPVRDALAARSVAPPSAP